MKTLNKLFVIPAFAFTLLSATAVAQTTTTTSEPYEMDAREELKVGIKAGINYSNVYSESGDGYVADGKVGFAGGVFVAIPLSKLVGIQPELLYSQKGFKTEGTFFDGKITSNHLDLPVHLQIKPSENISFLVGPQLSYLLSTKYEINGLSAIDEEDLEDENNRATLGISAGVDFTVQNFLISARGSWDLSKFNKDNSTSDINYKNQLFQITLGYRF
ncbi:porin family protein [Flavobacterium sp.]|uniref:porin family protein n=1 Tax=Flavobacterium sp. TaxID=239 RepID=UPI0026281360|nr:porin family protein [Flavobacterium sp.]MDD3004905.1 porin family protein [Flavobacterium sp.]